MTESHILTNGYILEPHTGGAFRNLPPQDPSRPFIVGPVPYIAEFSGADDFLDGGFIIKQSGSDMSVIPEQHRDFLPAAQAIINEEYAAGDATGKIFLARALRRTAAVGESHQPQTPAWHNHRDEGEVTIYNAADKLGTKFRTNAAAMLVPRSASPEEFYANLDRYGAAAVPPGVITRFNQNTEHGSPSPENESEGRRGFYVIVSYKNGLPSWRSNLRALDKIQNPIGARIHPSHKDSDRVIEAWRENAVSYFAQLAAKYADIRQPEGAVSNLVPAGVY